MRFLTLFRFLVVRSVGPAALQRGLALYLSIAMASVVIFARQGLDAATVVKMAQGSVFRALLFAAWTIATLPVARAILATPETGFLRALPIPVWQMAMALGSVLALAELPWFVLFARGGGVLHGAGALSVAMTTHAYAVSRSPTGLARAFFAATLIAWVMASPIVWLAVGGACLLHALPLAWRRASEIPRPRGAVIGRGPPAMALAFAYAASLARGHGPILLRTLVLASVGMGWGCLAVANNDAWSGDADLRSSILVAIWIPLGVFAAATPMGPVLRTEEQARWLLDMCNVRPSTCRWASVGLLASGGALLGLLAGASAGAGLGLALFARVTLAARLALWQVALSVVTESCARYALRGRGHDSARLILGLLVAIAFAEIALWAL